jgi:menaquinone-dependent protoporphyrinogen oxidase
VDVLPAYEAGDPSLYRAVVLGSAIRYGRLLPEAMSFIERNQEALRDVPFSIFIACMTLVINPDEEGRRTVDSYLDPVRALVKPVSEGQFAGVMDLSRLRFSERLLMHFLRIPRGDFRQWDEIEAWAEMIPLGEMKDRAA